MKISDSGRIRNELQTLCAEALEFVDSRTIRLHFDRIPPEVIPLDKQRTLLEVLRWYKKRHPLWFSWLELAEVGEAADVRMTMTAREVAELVGGRLAGNPSCRGHGHRRRPIQPTPPASSSWTTRSGSTRRWPPPPA